MARIIGNREAVGVTAEDLNPLDAKIVSELQKQTRLFKKSFPNLEKNDLAKKVDKLVDAHGLLTEKINKLKPQAKVIQIERKPKSKKLSTKDVNYEKSGPFPFICGQCVHLAPGNYCKLVEGPREDGRIGLEDTCQLFTSNLPKGA